MISREIAHCVYICDFGDRVKVGISRKPDERINFISSVTGVKPTKTFHIWFKNANHATCIEKQIIRDLKKEGKHMHHEWAVKGFYEDAKEKLERYKGMYEEGEIKKLFKITRLIKLNCKKRKVNIGNFSKLAGKDFSRTIREVDECEIKTLPIPSREDISMFVKHSISRL